MTCFRRNLTLRREPSGCCYCSRTVDRVRWICSTQSRNYSGAMDSAPGEGFVNTVDPKKTGAWLGSPFQFRACGQSGMMLSELLPGLAQHADDITLIRSMVSEHSNHEQAIWYFNTGTTMPGPTLHGIVDHLRARIGDSRSSCICRDPES